MADALKKIKTTAKTPRALTTPHRPRAERDRINFRIDARIKARAEDAAQILGQDLSTFAESALNEKAQAVIEREERIVLSERDFALFADALENPKPIGARLQAAAENYKAGRREQPELNW